MFSGNKSQHINIYTSIAADKCVRKLGKIVQLFNMTSFLGVNIQALSCVTMSVGKMNKYVTYGAPAHLIQPHASPLCIFMCRLRSMM